MPTITSSQELFLQMIEQVNFNELNGKRVASDLRANTNLWRAVMITRLVQPVFERLENPFHQSHAPVPLIHRVNLIVLRDLPANHINLDTIILYTEPGKQKKLEHLSQRWKPSTMAWYQAKESCKAMGEPLSN
jgi:hypothetical protein